VSVGSETCSCVSPIDNEFPSGDPRRDERGGYERGVFTEGVESVLLADASDEGGPEPGPEGVGFED